MQSLSDIRAIHDQPLRELAEAAASLHRGRWEASRAKLRGGNRVTIGACGKGCGCCTQGQPVPSAAPASIRAAEDVAAAAKALREAGQERVCVALPPGGGPDFESMLSLIRQLRAAGSEVCADLDVQGIEEARKLKGAGCRVLCRRLGMDDALKADDTKPCLSERQAQGFQWAMQAGLQVCFRCLLGSGDRAEDRLCLLHVLASGTMRPDVVHVRLPAPSPDGEDLLPASDVIRFIATTRILLPDCRIHLAMDRRRLDRGSVMMVHACGANSIEYIPPRTGRKGSGSYADNTDLPTRWVH